MLKRRLWATTMLMAGLAGQGALAQTVRIAEHRQARIDALEAVVPAIEEATGIDIEVVEYPGPDREYVAKLITELRAGSGPDVFSLPGSDVVDFATAGYLVDLTEDIQASEAWGQFFPVAQQLAADAEGRIFVTPTMLAAQQLYFRRDVLEEAGISTEQPQTWDELLQRAIDAKAATGAYGLLMPMGLTWGGGAFNEGFFHLLAGSSTPQLVTEDGKLALNSEGVLEVMGFYEQLVANDLLPVDPLLGPDPWTIPKYEMFPSGELLITTCGSWCYIFDWGPQSSNPIPDVTEAVGTWAVPGREGGLHVLVSLNHPWAVNANAADAEAARQVVMAMASVDLMTSYAANEGNLPARRDAAEDPGFQELTALVQVMGGLENGTFVASAPGFSVVAEGVARATEALLLKQADAAGAQAILVDYVSSALGPDAIE
ncbi:extracellular solute-binding protein [Rubellimicrobium rubrum]|uniref:Extracellular solute-binding protein n=2 Tax=Rubellimicrobium rubrum TaxID=2585369 RepID=A0A5C4N1N6_9RHOB|nr:extracellular solute-binding protein [Rubellimicrobium rubrum]